MDYLPKNKPQELIDSQVATFKSNTKTSLPGAAYVITYSHEEKRLIAVVPQMALSSQFSHATDYASGIFEGSSAMVNELTGIPHIILLRARSHRMFTRSLPARGFKAPVSQEIFNQAICDLVAINGLELFKNPSSEIHKKYVRAYIRPTIHPAALSGFGINMRSDYPINAAIIAWTWPDYLRPNLFTEGGISAITGHQRLFQITGKHASNYGAAVKDGNLARELGTDELIYLAPYLIDKNGAKYWADPQNVELKLRDGALSDGPGEECVAISADEKTLVYTPMRTNRLGGTVLKYIIDHLAKNIGLETHEADITLHDLRAKKYAAMAMVGNAVKVAPLRQIKLFKNSQLVEEIDLFNKANMPQILLKLIKRWDLETRGLVEPSHPSLLTAVDLVNGEKFRTQLDKMFS